MDPTVEPCGEPPGGGLEPDETVAECARREVLEETGISVRVGRIAFVREWVVPKHTQPPEASSGHGFGLEVYHYAWPYDEAVEPRPEKPGSPVARWMRVEDVPALPLWPKELKVLCTRILAGQAPDGAVSVIGRIESPLALVDNDQFESALQRSRRTVPGEGRLSWNIVSSQKRI